MKLITLKPLYLGGKTVVEGRSFETHDQHGRELIAKGYAALDESDAEPVVTLEEEPVVNSMALTSGQLSLTSPDAAVGDDGPALGKAATAKKKKAT